MLQYWWGLISKKFGLRVMACIACILVSVLLDMLGPMILRRAIDGLHLAPAWSDIAGYGAIICGMHFTGCAFNSVSQLLVNSVAVNMVTTVRRQLYAHFLKQEPDYFQKFQSMDLAVRATSDLECVRMTFEFVLPYALRAFFILIVVSPLVFRIEWKLGILFLLMLSVMLSTTIFLSTRMRRYSRNLLYSFMRLIRQIDENIAGMNYIRAYCQEKRYIETLTDLANDHRRNALMLARPSSFITPLVSLMIGIGFIVNTWYGSVLAAQDQITIGQFVEFHIYAMRAMLPQMLLGEVIWRSQYAIFSFQRINALLAMQTHIPDPPPRSESTSERGKVEFDRVTFRYSNDRPPALRGINAVFEGQQMTAIVGRSGSGKSTLTHLIIRILRAQEGDVRIDGVSVEDYPAKQLRSGIGCAMHQPFLFSGTIAENIGFANECARLQDIRLAAERAGLLEDIQRFPEGFDTHVGERGITLSGGQKQRLAIARAIIRQPKILILDDVFSSLDAKTEELILTHLLAAQDVRTTIIVSNHTPAVRNANMIYVLRNGFIVEQGTHTQLLANGGEYSGLCYLMHRANAS